MAMRGTWGWMVLVGGMMGLVACSSSPPSTPLYTQYQRGEERALQYYARGRIATGPARLSESLRWAEIVDDRPAIVAQALNVSTVALALGEWSLAEHYLLKALQVAQALSDPTSVLRAQLGLAEIPLRRGQFDAAQTKFLVVLDEGVRKRTALPCWQP